MELLSALHFLGEKAFISFLFLVPSLLSPHSCKETEEKALTKNKDEEEETGIETFRSWVAAVEVDTIVTSRSSLRKVVFSKSVRDSNASFFFHCFSELEFDAATKNLGLRGYFSRLVVKSIWRFCSVWPYFLFRRTPRWEEMALRSHSGWAKENNEEYYSSKFKFCFQFWCNPKLKTETLFVQLISGFSSHWTHTYVIY